MGATLAAGGSFSPRAISSAAPAAAAAAVAADTTASDDATAAIKPVRRRRSKQRRTVQPSSAGGSSVAASEYGQSEYGRSESGRSESGRSESGRPSVSGRPRHRVPRTSGGSSSRFLEIGVDLLGTPHAARDRLSTQSTSSATEVAARRQTMANTAAFGGGTHQDGELHIDQVEPAAFQVLSPSKPPPPAETRGDSPAAGSEASSATRDLASLDNVTVELSPPPPPPPLPLVEDGAVPLPAEESVNDADAAPPDVIIELPPPPPPPPPLAGDSGNKAGAAPPTSESAPVQKRKSSHKKHRKAVSEAGSTASSALAV